MNPIALSELPADARFRFFGKHAETDPVFVKTGDIGNHGFIGATLWYRREDGTESETAKNTLVFPFVKAPDLKAEDRARRRRTEIAHVLSQLSIRAKADGLGLREINPERSRAFLTVSAQLAKRRAKLIDR